MSSSLKSARQRTVESLWRAASLARQGSYLHLMVVETVAKIPNEPVISKAARSILRSIENSMTAVSASRGGVA